MLAGELFRNHSPLKDGSRIILNLLKMKKLFIVSLIFQLFVGCYKDNNILKSNNNNSKLEFRDNNFDNYYDSNGNFLLSKSEYLNLSNKTKKELWIHKIIYIESQNLDFKQSQYLLNLKSNINKLPIDSFYLTNSIRENAINLVNEFSETDFKNSFSSLDLNIISDIKTPICTKCKNDLLNDSSTIDAIKDPKNTLPKCNCRWFCSDPISGCNDCQAGDYEGCCKPRIGCGFLFLQYCTGHDQPCPGIGPDYYTDDTLTDDQGLGN